MYGRTSFGFKGHIAAHTQGLVKAYRFDTAATHESKYFNAQTRDEQVAVWADQAYFDYDRMARLTLREVLAGIARPRVRASAGRSASRRGRKRTTVWWPACACSSSTPSPE